MIRTYYFTQVDETDPWSGMLSATMFATRATFHTTLRATSMQLVFGHDALLNTTFEANWKYISQRKQTLIKKNNLRENAKRTDHVFH